VKGERADGSKIEGSYTVKYDGKEVATGVTGQPWHTTAAERELQYASTRSGADAAADAGDYGKAAELYRAAWTTSTRPHD